MASKRIAFLFPGQGSQYIGMGKDFFKQFPAAKHTFEEADEILQRKLSTIAFEGPESTLTETKNAQAAIFVNSLAILRVIEHQFNRVTPYACLGLSLGEYSALTASNRIRFENCLKLVDHRANYMDDACRHSKGTMAAVIGLDAEVVDQAIQELNLPHDIWVANYNSPGQIVISGTPKGVEVASKLLQTKGAKRVLQLQVHGAFHSGLMMPAQEKLKPYILSEQFQESSILIVMNASGDFAEKSDEVKKLLIEQVTSSVRWEQSIRRLTPHSIDLYIEIGCGKTLAGLNKRIGVTVPTISVDKVEDLALLDSQLKAILA